MIHNEDYRRRSRGMHVDISGLRMGHKAFRASSHHITDSYGVQIGDDVTSAVSFILLCFSRFEYAAQ